MLDDPTFEFSVPSAPRGSLNPEVDSLVVAVDKFHAEQIGVVGLRGDNTSVEKSRGDDAGAEDSCGVNVGAEESRGGETDPLLSENKEVT